MYSIFLNLDVVDIEFPIKIFRKDYVDDLLTCGNIEKVKLSNTQRLSLLLMRKPRIPPSTLSKALINFFMCFLRIVYFYKKD